jgi:poly(A) polymerase
MPDIRPPAGALHILSVLRGSGHRALLAGGCVRDHLMGLPPGDWDIVTGAGPDEVSDLFERTVPIGARFGVVQVHIEGGVYEVAQFRREEAYLDGRRPSAVHPAGEKEDALRRDFTINGMFFDPLAGEIIDLVGGRKDIERRCVRAIGDPAERFGEDHLRMLRAVRFAARFEYEIDPATFEAARRCAPLIRKTSAERVRDELTMMLTGGHADRALELLRETGLLKEVLPEAAAMAGVPQPPDEHPEGDVWTHTVMVLAQLTGPDGPNAPGLPLAWAALLHDTGKPETFTDTDRIRFRGHAAAGARRADEILERLNMPSVERGRICDLVRNHMKFIDAKEMRPATLKRFLREPFFADLLELRRMDCLACHGNLETYDFCRDKLANLAEEDLRPARVLDGNALAAMGFEPGPVFQEILSAVEDEQLEGRVRTREEAEAFVAEKFGDRKRPG